MLSSVLILVLLCVVLYNNANQQCELLDNLSTRAFHKIKACRRSNLPVISRTTTKSLSDCMIYAKERGGLAINFSPPGAAVSNYYEEYFFANCHVLGCPETATNFSGLINDTSFDYYSYFGNIKDLANSTCLKAIGLFQIFKEKANYTRAISKCQDIGGDLAHIVSEVRTNSLSNLVKEALADWYKVAYVGLDDIEKEGRFVTALGDPLNCFKFRAWAPGHPRHVRKHEDCVIVDLENVWKVANCKRNLSFICEIFPSSPKVTIDLTPTVTTATTTITNCSEIEDLEKRKKCETVVRKRSVGNESNSTDGVDRCIEQEDEDEDDDDEEY